MITTMICEADFNQTGRHTILMAVIVIGLWLAATIYYGLQGVFSVDGPRLALPAVTLGPIAAYLVAYSLSPKLRGLIMSLDLRLLVLLHAVRTVGLGFLFLYAYGVLPGLFAWPAAVGDALTAFAALGLGVAMFMNRAVSLDSVWRWNLFGLMDFIIAVLIGMALRSDLLGGPINTDPMGTLPLVLFPAFAVPLMAIVHLMIFQKLANSSAPIAGQ